MRTFRKQLYLLILINLPMLIYLFYSLRFLSDEDIENLENEKKYFQSQPGFEQLPLLILNDKCEIPSMPLWNNDTFKGLKNFRKLSMFKKCLRWKPRLTFMHENNVVIDEKALSRLNLTMNKVFCCYRSILRMEASMLESPETPDHTVGFSKDCIPMRELHTTVNSRFIVVTCWKSHKPLYLNFHAIPLFPPSENETSKSNVTIKPKLTTYWKSEAFLRKKLKFWKQCDGKKTFTEMVMEPNEKKACSNYVERGALPFPHVLIIGIDSTSRTNFHRFMKKSVKLLEKIGAVEMKGFTKAGETILPLLGSFPPQDLSPMCFEVETEIFSFDKCPLIWNEFAAQKYITSYLEDNPMSSVFHSFNRRGFLHEPVDFYMQPFMFAAYKYHDGARFDLVLQGKTVDCIGYQRPEKIILQFALDLILSAEKRRAPTFNYLWLNDLTRWKFNTLTLLDNNLSWLIKELKFYKVLEKMVLIIVGNQGYNSGDFRQTLSGWYESKLPTLWIKIPKVYKDRYRFNESLLHNARQIVTPYDLHATLRHIVLLNENISAGATGNYFVPKVPFLIKKGISLFSKIPSRTCEEANVAPGECACNLKLPFRIGTDYMIRAAAVATNTLNTLLPSRCSSLKLTRIEGWAILRHSKNLRKSGINDGDRVALALLYNPGEFALETEVEYNSTNGFKGTEYFERVDKKESAIAPCVEEDHPMAKLCVCSSEDN